VSDPPPLLEVRDLVKSFGGSYALNQMSLKVDPGEIHGLLGANGSGKSTLIKTLAGYHAADSGEIYVRGRLTSSPLSSAEARSLGLAFVHQDLGLVPSLSALENFLLGSLAAARRRLWISWRDERRKMREVMERYGLDLDPRVPVGEMAPVHRALLSIVRALEAPGIEVEFGDRIIILDEPTVFLPRHEVNQLFELLRNIVRGGSSVVFVSHDVDEVREISDRVTVMRNGRVALSGETSSLSGNALIEAIVGVRLDTAAVTRLEPPRTRASSVEVRNLAAGAARDVSFTADAGEIIGLTGLLGSGYDDVVRALAGAAPAASGILRIDDTAVDLAAWSTRAAVSGGVVLIPGDRLTEGVIAELPVTDNVTMLGLRDYVHRGFLSRRAMIAQTGQLAQRYDVRPADPGALVGHLSGGNQQKVLLAKWLQTTPRVLLLEEPTQGVDVGARQQIFATIRESPGGRVVICASSDHDQLVQLCDRVLILRRGQVAAELSGTELTKSRIAEECLRGDAVGSVAS
jgi:ribose transport system ATP-binding protein